MLTGNDDILLSIKNIAGVFNSFFQTNYRISCLYELVHESCGNVCNIIDRIINNLTDHPSIRNIKLKFKTAIKVFFIRVAEDLLRRNVKELQ